MTKPSKELGVIEYAVPYTQLVSIGINFCSVCYTQAGTCNRSSLFNDFG